MIRLAASSGSEGPEDCGSHRAHHARNSTGDAVFGGTLKTALNVSLQQSPMLSESAVTKILQHNDSSAQPKANARI